MEANSAPVIPVWVIVPIPREWVSKLHLYVLILQALSERNFEIVTRENQICQQEFDCQYVIRVDARGNIPMFKQRLRVLQNAEQAIHDLYKHALDEEADSQQSHAPRGGYRPYRPPTHGQ